MLRFFYGILRRFHITQISRSVESGLEFLCVDLTVFVQNVSVDVGDHVNLRMAGVTLSSLQVTVVQLQLVSRTGMPLWYNNDKPEMPTNPWF